MPKSLRYPLLEIRDIMTNILKEDEYISSIVTYKDSQSKEEFVQIYKNAIEEIKIPVSRAISVFYFGDLELASTKIGTLNMYSAPVFVAILCQDPNKDKAIEECIKLAGDIFHTFENSDLKSHWEYKLESQETTKSEMTKALYTHVLVQTYTGFPRSHQYL